MHLPMFRKRPGPGPRLVHLAAFWRRREGNVAVELALIAPVLLLLLLGLVDFGRAVGASRQLSATAAAAVLFTVHNGDFEASKAEAIRMAQAATNEYGISATVDVVESYLCGSATADRATVCADGRLPAHYVEVALSSTHPLLFALPGLPKTIPLAGRAVMRAQ